MATENGWRAREDPGELSKLGIDVSLATISRYLPKIKSDPGAAALDHFPSNHRDAIAAMDFFVVPTLGFRLLYVWFATRSRKTPFFLRRHRKSTARWVSQQLSNTFSSTPNHRS